MILYIVFLFVGGVCLGAAALLMRRNWKTHQPGWDVARRIEWLTRDDHCGDLEYRDWLDRREALRYNIYVLEIKAGIRDSNGKLLIIPPAEDDTAQAERQRTTEVW